MPGIIDLSTLLGSMEPELRDREYVFATLRDASPALVEELRPIGTFREDEGLTLIVERAVAQAHDMDCTDVFRLITLHVHSSLQAVGLTAAFSAALGRRGISANVVAAYFHDHIFVPSARAHEALSVLQTLAAEQRECQKQGAW